MTETQDPTPDTDVDMIEQTLEPQAVEDPGENPAPDEPQRDAEPTPEDIAAVEAVLLATDSPLSPSKIAGVLDIDNGRKIVRRAVELLNERYERMGCSFRIEPLAGGFQMLTLPEYNDVLRRLLKVRDESRLSTAAMETLAIVAYKQPILRADVEAIRGVSSGEMIRNLMEKNLVKIVGRAEEIGRPMLYGTTRTFLEVFGLKDLAELPKVEALANIPQAPKTQDDEQGEPADDETQGPDDPQTQPQAEAPDAKAGDQGQEPHHTHDQ